MDEKMWTGFGELRICFPRIFTLVRVKSGPVKNSERWEEWRWR